ncbi:MAG: transcriptional regulator GlxA family with amidase domain [Kangiellaceae bacterium]|jgi:transcriptional regulator GlxA family with amidase domain
MPYFKPLQVVIVGFDGVLGSALTGALDLFSFTGVSWQRFVNEPVEPRFTVRIASLYKQNITCSNRLTIVAHCDLAKVKDCDLLMIPTIGDSIDKVLGNTKGLLPHIIRLSKQGVDIASNCSGAFLVASAGLLDNKEATTHWGYADKFKHDFPQVNLTESKLITQQDNIFCAAGGSAFYDLGLLLIERYCGRDIAGQVAKTQVIDSRRRNQSLYANVNLYKSHPDTLVREVQDYIEDNFTSAISVSSLCKHFNIIPRTLNRRFQSSVHMRPLAYIQAVRIEQAKRLLELGETNIKSLASAVGYEDNSSFTRLFKRMTSLTPKEYKDKSYKTPSN